MLSLFRFLTHQQMSILWVKEDLCLKRNGLQTKILGLVAKQLQPENHLVRIAFYISAITVICQKALISALLSGAQLCNKMSLWCNLLGFFKQNSSDCSETVELHQLFFARHVHVLSPNGSTSRILHCMGGGFLTDILQSAGLRTYAEAISCVPLAPKALSQSHRQIVHGGSVSCRWRYRSRMIACCVCYNS